MPPPSSKVVASKPDETTNKIAELPLYSEAARIAAKDFDKLDTCKDLGLERDEFLKLELPGVSASAKKHLFEQMLRLTRTPEHSYGELSREDLRTLEVAPYLRSPTAQEVSVFFEVNRETFGKIVENRSRREEFKEKLCDRLAAAGQGQKLNDEIAKLDKAHEKLVALLRAPYVALTGDILASVSGHDETFKVQFRDLNSFGLLKGMHEPGKGFRLGFISDTSAPRSIILREDGTLFNVNYQHLLNQE